MGAASGGCEGAVLDDEEEMAELVEHKQILSKL
jgi:hypothetical protein